MKLVIEYDLDLNEMPEALAAFNAYQGVENRNPERTAHELEKALKEEAKSSVETYIRNIVTMFQTRPRKK